MKRVVIKCTIAGELIAYGEGSTTNRAMTDAMGQIMHDCMMGMSTSVAETLRYLANAHEAGEFELMEIPDDD